MKQTSFRIRILGVAVCILLGLLPIRGTSQIPNSDKVLMGYIDESFFGTYKDDKYNFLVWDGEGEPVVLPSLLSDINRYGRVMAGTWVNNEFYCITMSVEEEKNLYIAYEPLSRSIRIIGVTSVYMGTSNCDMAYNEKTGELFALQSATTGTWLYKLSLTDTTSQEIKGSSGSSGITLDGVVPSDGSFVGLAFNSRGELYTVYSRNEEAQICRVNPQTASASVVATTGIRAGTSNSLTFAGDPDKLYWYTLYQGDYVWEVNLTDGDTQKVKEEELGPFTTLCHPKYPQGAPASPVSDLRVLKNPADYKEATFYCTLPTHDLQENTITGKMRVEIWKGKDLDNMVKIDSLSDREPGERISYTHTETQEGTFYFAFRVFVNGFNSPFTHTLCPFYNVTYPYQTGFEKDDEKGAVIAEGEGWQHWENYRQYDWQPFDTLVRTGKYSYGVNLDTVSRLRIGNGLYVYKGVEYEFSFYVIGHAKIVYGGRWIEGPLKPLEISYNGKDTLLTLPKQGEGVSAIKPYRYFDKYTYRFIAKENGPLDISFRAVGDDSYFIDDFEINQLTLPEVPGLITDLAVNDANTETLERKLSVSFTVPAKTLGNEDLSAPVDVVMQWSRYRNFTDELGQESMISQTLSALQPGSVQTVDRTFDKEGFYYVRAYAVNDKGESPLSGILEAGYMGKGYSFDLTVTSKLSAPIENVSVSLLPLYPEGEEAYAATTSATGKVALTDLYTGRYKMELRHSLYETYQAELRLEKDTVLTIKMEDKIFYPAPKPVSGLKITSTDADLLQVNLSWTNPSEDVDGNALVALNGLIVSYSIEGAALVTLDTVKQGLPGNDMTYTAELKEQGKYTLSVSAYNEYGCSEEVSVEVGYVGNGFDKTFVCRTANGEALKNVHISLFSTEGEYSAMGDESGKVKLTGVRRGNYELFAMVDYYDRLIKENLRVEDETEQVLEDFVLAMPEPELTGFVQEDHRVVFNWKQKENRNFTDGFETYADFEIEQIGQYKLGGAKSKGYFGGCTWPNILEDQSWIVFNPFSTFPPVNEYTYWSTHSGNKMLCALYTVRNDDWLVRAVDGGGILKFWAKGPQIGNADPERFVVLYSTTDDNFGNFVKVSEGDFVETTKEWIEYSFELPDNARYFAIHCVSNDASVLQIDDLSYTLSHGQKVRPAQGFEVYMNNARVAVLSASDTSYVFENLPDGQHTLGLKAVYEEGTSPMITRTVAVGNYVATPINVKVEDVNGEWVISYEMPRGEKAQYFKIFLDWELYEHVEDFSCVLPSVNPAVEHVAGVCAVDNERFSDTVWVKFNTVSNEPVQESKISVVPNPCVDGKVRIETRLGGTLEIFGMDGRKVQVQEIAAGVQEVRLNQPQGLYLITVTQLDGSRLVTRLVVAR